MQPTIVKAKRPHDLLALVPQLSGFVPTNSVVLVAFRGRRTCGALRFNLPDPLAADAVHKRIATTMAGMLCKLPGVDFVVPVIYTDDTFSAAVGVPGTPGIPHRRFAERLVSRLGDSGFGIRDALCVGGDGWGSFFDPECPETGHPLSDIIESDVNGARPAPSTEPLGSGGQAAIGTLTSLADLPVVTRSAKESFGRMYRRYTRAVASPDSAMALIDTLTDLLDPVELAERALEWEPEGMTDEESAGLLLMLQSPATRDQMMVQFAFGVEQGRRAYLVNARYAALQQATGLGMDELVWSEVAAAKAAGATDEAVIRMVQELGSDILLGETGVRPDGDRIERGIMLLKRVVALAPRAARPAPLCMLAWLSWALGLGTVGGLFVDRALAIDAEYGMALVLHQLISSGRLPEWSFNDPAGA